MLDTECQNIFKSAPMERYSAAITGAANLQEGDPLKAILEEDRSICLVPKSVEYRKLLKQSQLTDFGPEDVEIVDYHH